MTSFSAAGSLWEDTETELDIDAPPAFPSPFSAQRVATPLKLPQILTSDSQRMPPPPLPHLVAWTPGVTPSSRSAQPSAAPASLAVPTTTTKRPAPPSKKRGNPLDWAALKSSGADLRGVDTLLRIPPSVLKQHNKRDDAWSAFNGKVYNMTAYLSFHPGGERELMRVAGRDGTKLFASTHAWVNVDFMLDSCLVGFLIAEPAE
ncbi:cytochrome b5-like heme/steroid binding domain-containing protein [Infundibulicybe gibba]|nr:cytochrome b5-like heme/steroid binding domain-containing protein [Infundibulicybe gibba]